MAEDQKKVFHPTGVVVVVFTWRMDGLKVTSASMKIRFEDTTGERR